MVSITFYPDILNKILISIKNVNDKIEESPTTSNNYSQFTNQYHDYTRNSKNDTIEDSAEDLLSEHGYEPDKKRGKDVSMQQLLEKNLLFSKYFTIKETVKNGIIGECRVCNTTIKASATVTSNFIRHLKCRHPNEFEKYIQLKIANGKKETAKSKIDTALLDYIIENMLSFALVESSTFKTFVNSLNSNYTPPTLQVVIKMFNERYNYMVDSIQEKLKDNSYFCTTADIWSTKHKLFFAYICHWIDPKSFKRISTTLSLKRFKRSHNCEKIKDVIEETHRKYDLNINNIMATVTGNASNFKEVFKQIGINKFCNEGEIYNDDEFDCIDVGEHLLQTCTKCAGRTLNKFVSADFNDTLVECQLYDKMFVILHKCNALWLNSQNDIIKTLLGNTLKHPVITKWISLYYSIIDIVKYKNNINDVCGALQFPKFTDDDFIYLQEYIEVNNPLAEAIQFLQHDNNMLYGYLLPTLATIRMKIKILFKSCNKNKYFTDVFLTKLEEKLLLRFPNYFALNEAAESAIIASVLCPDVKLDWVKALYPGITNGEKEELARKVQNIIESEHNVLASQEEELPNSSKYFQFTTQENSYPSVKSSNEFLTYMVDTSRNIEMLNKYPNLKKAFIKYNTPLPSSSSALIDRLFSYSGLDLTTHSGLNLSDDYQEKLVLLKIN